MNDGRRSLVSTLYAVDTDGEIVVEVAADARITGVPSRVERDEAGIRIEVCPYDGNAPQYRVRAGRTPLGWRRPVVERRRLHGDWDVCGPLTDVVT